MSKAAPGWAFWGKEKDQSSLEQSEHLLRTKFLVSPIRLSHIPRSCIHGLIDYGVEWARIPVSAPSGYGRTTLVNSRREGKRHLPPGSLW